MLRRCYNERELNKQPTYRGCSVCDEWHNFQNFAQWYTDNYYEIDGECMELDKDILHKGNKIYSPDNCVFVPQCINKLFIKCDKKRGLYPIGINYDKKYNKYNVSCNNGIGTRIGLGTYNTIEEGFKVYKNYKENYIKQIADEYKNKIPNRLYNAMYKYEVEITD